MIIDHSDTSISLEIKNQEACISFIARVYSDDILETVHNKYKNDDGTLVYQEVKYFLQREIILHFHSDIFIDIEFFNVASEEEAMKIAAILLRY